MVGIAIFKRIEESSGIRNAASPSKPHTKKVSFAHKVIMALGANNSQEIASTIYTSKKWKNRLKEYFREVFFSSAFQKLTSGDQFPHLCFDAIEHVFSYLSAKDLCRLQAVCQLFNGIIQHSNRLKQIINVAKDDYELNSTKKIFETIPVTNRKLIQFLTAHHPAYRLHNTTEAIECTLSIKADSFKASAINRNYFTYDQIDRSYSFSIKFHAALHNQTDQAPLVNYFITVLDQQIVYSDIFYRSKLPFGIRNRILDSNEKPRIINSFHKTLNPK